MVRMQEFSQTRRTHLGLDGELEHDSSQDSVCGVSRYTRDAGLLRRGEDRCGDACCPAEGSDDIHEQKNTETEEELNCTDYKKNKKSHGNI